MLILGIDPGSLATGWGLIKCHGNKINYLASGVLKFDKKAEFNNRLLEIRTKLESLLIYIEPDEVAMESLIYVKSPTSLIKLAQARGVILSVLLEKYQNKIFEYSPNLVKSTAVGHGHADKVSVQKFLNTLIGPRDYETHDESDALAVAICHFFNKDNQIQKPKTSKAAARGLSASLMHKIG